MPGLLLLATFRFELPQALFFGIPIALLLLTAHTGLTTRRSTSLFRPVILSLLRLLSLLILLFFLARPVSIAPSAPPNQTARSVLVLLDRSESMSLQDTEKPHQSRFAAASHFLQKRLRPALQAAGLPYAEFVFAEQSSPLDPSHLDLTRPEGKRTDLASAILHAFQSQGTPPLAVVALTDGIVTDGPLSPQTLAALDEARTPFLGIGFGADSAAPILSLRQIDAPAQVAPNATFRISVMLEATGNESLPAFDLGLFRDGQLLQTRHLPPAPNQHTWIESFQVAESELGKHRFEVRMLLPDAPNLHTVSTSRSAEVRVEDPRELRVLYAQGALTWDYKFISLALHDDPSLKVTGLTRTSQQTFFRQNVEDPSELHRGFPTSLDELAPYRAVVLSNLKPTDLSTPQQELLARFVFERGGGLLLIGGADTFDASWKGSRLEQLLPVFLSSGANVQGLDRPFHLKILEEALSHPVFAVEEHKTPREVWNALPTFTSYGRIDAPKPGATIFAEHSEDQGPKGPRILMASQRYGAGITTVLAVQNFWRWRLAKDADPRQFDRFWRQLFRHLASAGQQEWEIQCTDRAFTAPMEVHLAIQASRGMTTPPPSDLLFEVLSPTQQQILSQRLAIHPSIPTPASFAAKSAGLYTLALRTPEGRLVASRAFEIPEQNAEFERTAREMESLRQWAFLTGGIALKAEECTDASQLVSDLQRQVQIAQRRMALPVPVPLRAWILALLLGALGTEWILRKRWSLP